jgi:hypothetical protein
MSQIKIITTALLVILTINATSQTIKRKNYFPIWTFHQDNININGISIGLLTVDNGPRFTNTNGIKFELIGFGVLLPLIPRSPIVETDSAFVNLKQQPLSERINGLNLSTSGTFCHCLTNGLTAGLIGQINFHVNGISTSLYMNFNQKHNGLMVAMFNEAYYMNGLQIGLSNYGSKTKGIQLALISNKTNDMNGLQIGLFNKSKKFKGLQIGLWNVNQKRKFPLINWNFNRDTD